MSSELWWLNGRYVEYHTIIIVLRRELWICLENCYGYCYLPWAGPYCYFCLLPPALLQLAKKEKADFFWRRFCRAGTYHTLCPIFIKSNAFISHLFLTKEVRNVHVHCFSWSCSVVDCSRFRLDVPFNQQFKLVARIWGRVMQPNSFALFLGKLAAEELSRLNKNIARVRNCPDITISNFLFVF